METLILALYAVATNVPELISDWVRFIDGIPTGDVTVTGEYDFIYDVQYVTVADDVSECGFGRVFPLAQVAA